MSKKQPQSQIDTTRQEQQFIGKMLSALEDAWWGSASGSAMYAHLDALQNRIHDYLMSEMRATYEKETQSE